jgi:hypothetical protein
MARLAGWHDREGPVKERRSAAPAHGQRRARSARTVTDGSYIETKEVIVGFSIIEARDIDEAVRIASGCPMLEAGSSVEVRSVMQLPV